MRRLVALGVVALGAVAAYEYWPREPRRRLKDAVRRRMLERVEQVMASLPEDAPPKLVQSVLPRLQAQNEEIIALLRTQNELLRERVSETAPKAAA